MENQSGKFVNLSELTPLTQDELAKIDGGLILLNAIRPLAKVAEFVVGELADFAQGFWEGVKPIFK